MLNNIKTTKEKVSIERIGHLGRTKDSHEDLFISYELNSIDMNKISRFYLVVRHGKFAISMDVDEDEIKALLDFIQSKKGLMV